MTGPIARAALPPGIGAKNAHDTLGANSIEDARPSAYAGEFDRNPMTTSEMKFLKPEKLPQAWASRFAYGYGVQTGELVWISGQISRNSAGELVGKDDIHAQAVQVFENIKAVVEAAGGTMADVITTTTYITDRPFREVVTKVRHKYFPGPDYPGNTLLIINGLGLPEYLVEIEAVAWVKR